MRVRAPPPDSVGPHPAGCDWITYLRFRSRGGPRQPERRRGPRVDAGFLGGASSFDQLARNVVRNGTRRGKDLEFWALDRRANWAEDWRGIAAADRAQDPKVAFDYWGTGG